MVTTCPEEACRAPVPVATRRGFIRQRMDSATARSTQWSLVLSNSAISRSSVLGVPGRTPDVASTATDSHHWSVGSPPGGATAVVVVRASSDCNSEIDPESHDPSRFQIT